MKKEKKIRISMYLDARQIKALENIAESIGINKSQIIRKLIDDFINKDEKKISITYK